MTFSHRLLRHALLLLVVLAALALSAPAEATADCRTFRLTGYVRGDGSAYTYDGTSVWTSEPIVAASWDVEMGSYVDIDGLGLHRVADRGMLGSSGWLDVLVDTRAQAYALTGFRAACVVAPGEIG